MNLVDGGQREHVQHGREHPRNQGNKPQPGRREQRVAKHNAHAQCNDFGHGNDADPLQADDMAVHQLTQQDGLNTNHQNTQRSDRQSGANFERQIAHRVAC